MPSADHGQQQRRGGTAAPAMFRLTLPARDSALSQVILVGFICFCCPGIYNAIVAMAGGIGDPSVNNAANAWLYSCFAVSSLVAPAVCNRLGPQKTLFLGTLGYLAFVVALYLFSRGSAGGGAVIAAAAANGVSAALLWTAQGQLCMAYPTKELKGTYFALFWVIFNVGGVVGGGITFATNYESDGATASGTTFLVFMAIMVLGSCLTLFVLPPGQVKRSDGTGIVITPHGDTGEELRAMAKIFKDKGMLKLIPMFLYSNWFLGYHFGVYNAGLFNARTQGLTTAFYWGAEMAGAFAIGRFLDGREYGTARKRQVCFVSAGPDRRFGLYWEFYDLPPPRRIEAMKAARRDNLYSYAPDWQE